MSSNITEVQHDASETGSASSKVLSAAQSLSQDSNRLKLELGRFLNTVRAAQERNRSSLNSFTRDNGSLFPLPLAGEG